MRALTSIALASWLAVLAVPASAQQATVPAGQGTGLFQMTPPIPGYNAPAPARSTTSQASPSQVPANAAEPSNRPAPAAPSPDGQQIPSPTTNYTPQTPPPAAPTGTPAPTAMPFQMVPGQPVPTAAAPAASTPAAPQAPAKPDRYIIPQPRMIFSGEVASRAWVIYASQDEAARQATFLLSYLNSVVVMPETSRIRVTINGQAIIESPIASSQEPSAFAVPIPRGTLRAGANLVRMDVVQRHRTDCAVNATYELWTEINNEGTGIAFAGGRPILAGGLDDLPSVGFDTAGVTNIRVVTPGPIEGGGSARVLRAVQGLSVRGQFPNPSVSIVEGLVGPAPAGTLTVVIGSASELPRLMATSIAEARQRTITTFVNDDRLGAPTLVLSGPTPPDVDRAIDRVNDIRLNQRDSIVTQTQFAPNAPLFDGSRSVRLADLGVTTQEFSGRRFRAEFQIALPPDFFAEYYGNAELLLDAAFTAAVRPGSHVDVYVNQQIASNLPITIRGGGLLQHERMSIPLRNFRPGINRLWLEVILDTESDARCLPGATLPADNRFVLFDSSEFVLGNFARIGTVPNLAAFTADSFPYNLNNDPMAVVLARQDASTLSAASTLMSRLALANGAPLPLDASPASVTLGERNTIFVGDIDHISASVLDQVGIAESTRANWVVSAGDDDSPPGTSDSYDNVLQRFRSRQNAEAAAAAAVPSERPAEANTPEVYQRWRSTVQSTGALNAISDSVEGWLQRTFSISFESLRINEGRRILYEPPPRTSVLMAQGNSTNGSAVWTLVTGRTPETLANAMVRLTAASAWNRIGGQAIAFQASTGDIERRDSTSHRYIVTVPLSFGNMRMISANWLSTNIMPYALMLILAATILGVTTAFLLRRLGRPT